MRREGAGGRMCLNRNDYAIGNQIKQLLRQEEIYLSINTYTKQPSL